MIRIKGDLDDFMRRIALGTLLMLGYCYYIVLQLFFLLIIFQMTDPCSQVKDKRQSVPV